MYVQGQNNFKTGDRFIDVREITIFLYRDSAPLPVRMRNRRYISYLHIIDFNKCIYLFYLVTYFFISLFYLCLENDEFISHIKIMFFLEFYEDFD